MSHLISESSIWRSVGTGWSPLHGSFTHHGFSLEAHDFPLRRDMDWGRSFHPDSVELCLNLLGTATLTCRNRTSPLPPATAMLYRIGSEPIEAIRPAAERHRFVTLECRRDWLQRTLAGNDQFADPLVRECIVNPAAPTTIGAPRELSPAAITRIEELWKPPVATPVRGLWFEARVLELVAEFLFPPQQELFCDRQKRVARERVAKVREILTARLAEPPTLDELSRLVGMSQFYLSRTFSQEMRMTIPQFIRQLRMEKAAELLRAGTHNVTEAAFAVGYSSLGHFSKNFCEVMGACPTMYPQLSGPRGGPIANRR